eukprot:gnl/Hemi2/24028_TR8057_c0_g1_i1.p1 gnl/Hemi2/24028_TR8057_c0_g1~~gnl/Hemi2/24028_TR8057_c0_g1_i1.p1  ORF type:complete len:304 (-),score=91.67 gnl/Hemi2/24028_TR8057_c0_g1_i1:179-1090(-)
MLGSTQKRPADEMGGSDLHQACLQGDLNKTNKILLVGNTNVNQTNWHRTTALHCATAANSTDVVRLLVKKAQAHVNVPDMEGVTPLHIAAKNGNMDVVKLLLARGAQVYASDKMGNTPVQWALRAGHRELAQMLDQRIQAPSSRPATHLLPIHCRTVESRGSPRRLTHTHTLGHSRIHANVLPSTRLSIAEASQRCKSRQARFIELHCQARMNPLNSTLISPLSRDGTTRCSHDLSRSTTVRDQHNKSMLKSSLARSQLSATSPGPRLAFTNERPSLAATTNRADWRPATSASLFSNQPNIYM